MQLIDCISRPKIRYSKFAIYKLLNQFRKCDFMVQKIRHDIVFGNTIRQLRVKQNLTQEDVIIKMQLLGIKISRSAYSQIECGTYNIRVSELVALTQIFKIDYNGLFAEADTYYKINYS